MQIQRHLGTIDPSILVLSKVIGQFHILRHNSLQTSLSFTSEAFWFMTVVALILQINGNKSLSTLYFLFPQMVNISIFFNFSLISLCLIFMFYSVQ